MLTAGDEYPIHQTPEPIAFSGSDRNFYDRFFFNGYNEDGSVFFAAAMGVYPHLNIIDGAVSILRNGKQSSVFLSRPLNMDRMDTHVGGLSVEVLKPLKQIRLKLEETEGIALDVTFDGRAFPIEEPRFTYRQGPRMLIDCTRMTQNGRWQGRLGIDGEEITVSSDSWTGTRDRSWGVRPIGSLDPQQLVPVQLPQFYWIWTPLNFNDKSVFFHVNDDAAGNAWNTRAVIVGDGASKDEHSHMVSGAVDVAYRKGTRRAEKGSLTLTDETGRERSILIEPQSTFLMKGIGYGHPTWRHGAHHGEQLAVAREEFSPDEANWQQPDNLHIQAISKVTLTDEKGATETGVGAFEQLFIGKHAPSGFNDILDGAA